MKTTLPHLAAIRVDGNDGRDFLHRQLSADINALAAGDATTACLCQPKGRVIATVLIIGAADHLWIVCSSSLAEKVISWLQRFVFRDDVRFVTDDTFAVITGDDATTAVSPVANLAYDIDTEDLAEQDEEAARAFRARELAAGIAWLDETSSEAFLPQMIGADAIGALNYRKGCYPGQEIVARTHYLGKLKQRPVLVKANGPDAPAVMDKVKLETRDDEIDAQVVDISPDGDGSRVILVARSQEPTDIKSMTWDGGRAGVEAEWPEVASRQKKNEA